MKAIVFAAALFAVPAAAQTVTECDRLAAHGEDPDRIAPAVSQSAMDKPAAQAACEAAVATDSANARLRYQLGRAYFYDAKYDKAMPHLEFAAGAGSEQAQFVLGYIIDEAMGGQTKEPCKVEDLWFKSAKQGRFAAQTSYVHHATRGGFKGCTLQATPADMDAFLTGAAQKKGNDYYQTLLVAMLKEDLAAYKARTQK